MDRCPHCGGPLAITPEMAFSPVNVNGLNGAPYVTGVSIVWPSNAAAGGMPPIKLYDVTVGGPGR